MILNTKRLKDVEIGFPVIAEDLYHAKIVKPLVKPNKAGDGNNLVVQFKILDNPLRLHKDGSEIENKGQLVLTRYFSLTPTPDYDPDKAMKELAVAIRHPEDADLQLEDLEGKMVIVKLTHRPAGKDDKTGKEYGESNEVKRVTPVPEEDTFTPPPFA